MKTLTDLPVLFDYFDGPVTFDPRECTPAETARLVARHDSILAEKPDPAAGECVDPQLICPAVPPGEAGASIAWIVSPCEPGFYIPALNGRPKRLVAALYCPGHDPGTPLADSVNLGRIVTAAVFFDSEPNDSLWGHAPLYPETK